MIIVSVENSTGPDVFEFPYAGKFYSVQRNQIIDVPLDVALHLMDAYDYLTENSRHVEGDEDVKPEEPIQEEAEPEKEEPILEDKKEVTTPIEDKEEPIKEDNMTPKEKFEAEMKKGERYVCSMCDEDFSTDSAMKTHIAKKHE